MGIPLGDLAYVVFLRGMIACGDATAPAADPTSRWAYLACNDRYDGALTGGVTFDSPPWHLGLVALFAPTIILAVGVLAARFARWWSYERAATASLAALLALLVAIPLGNEDDISATRTAADLERTEPHGTRVSCEPADGGYWEYRCVVRRPGEAESRTSVVVSDRGVVARSE